MACTTRAISFSGVDPELSVEPKPVDEPTDEQADKLLRMKTEAEIRDMDLARINMEPYWG